MGRYRSESCIADDGVTIRGMRFFAEQQQASSRDYVYLGVADDYFDDPAFAGALMLASGKNHIVCRGGELEELLNDTLAAFEFFNGIEQRLYAAAADNAPLAEMVGFVGEALPDPFFVFGIDGTLLASAHSELLSPGTFRDAVAEGSLGAINIVTGFHDGEGNALHDLADKPQALVSEEMGQGTGVDMYLSVEGEPVGFIVYVAMTAASCELGFQLEPVFAPLLVQAAEFASPESAHQPGRAMLAEALVGNAPPQVVSKLHDRLGAPGPFAVVSVKSLAIQNRTMKLVLVGELESADAPCICCEIDDVVTAVMAQADLPAFLGALPKKVNVKDVMVGVSMPAVSFTRLPGAYRQSLFALDAENGAGIRFCRELAFSYILQEVRAESGIEDLLHPALHTLRDYDEAHGSDLVTTLTEYLAHNCNQVHTAKALHVHLNTLKHRIARISELTSVDFKDGRELLYLHLSLEVG